jgi:murein DD-endopeptidase MepM/ murein hydrolase activator NlpD
MSRVVELLRSRLWPRTAALALIAVGAAACSSETTRFNDNPFGSRGAPEATGSIPQAQVAPGGRVESGPLPPQPGVPAAGGIAGGGRGMASYTPSAVAKSPAQPGAAPEVTGSVAKPAPSGSWTWDGGKPITVGAGDTVDGIARRYGVPASAIMAANNLTPPATIQAGQQLVIPRYRPAATAAAAAPAPAPVARKPVATISSPAGKPGVHVVAHGETLSRISRLYGKPVGEIAKANNIAPTAKLSVGDRLVIPGVRVSAAKSNAVNATPVAQAKPAAPTEPETVQTASMVTPVADAPGPKDAVKAADGALPKFRWPANGRVITGFGPSPNGQQNDGINIALPENTPVKAAEDGVVAYAGSELKGYGNLVLVRHSNGFVTAYAHAKELTVKRGDQVKRGQVIARSGQTGSVNAPQLHFEIRKGAAPLDPMPFLNGA